MYYKRAIRLQAWLSASLLFAMFVLVVLQVVSRYVFRSPLPWTEELARYVMIWMVFVASAHLASTGDHIIITLIDKILPAAWVRWIIALAYLLVVLACLMVINSGWTFVVRMFKASSPAMSLPMGWVYLASFSGMLMIMLQSLVNMILIMMGRMDDHMNIETDDRPGQVSSCP